MSNILYIWLEYHSSSSNSIRKESRLSYLKWTFVKLICLHRITIGYYEDDNYSCVYLLQHLDSNISFPFPPSSIVIFLSNKQNCEGMSHLFQIAARFMSPLRIRFILQKKLKVSIGFKSIDGLK